jgi:hypothetical protein
MYVAKDNRSATIIARVAIAKLPTTTLNSDISFMGCPEVERR